MYVDFNRLNKILLAPGIKLKYYTYHNNYVVRNRLIELIPKYKIIPRGIYLYHSSTLIKT